jgi:kexin
MIIIVWTVISSLILSGLASPAPRTYDTHNYYVLRHISSAASLAHVVQALDVELVEQAGELQDHWIVRQLKPQETIHPRSVIDPVLSAFETLKAHAELPLITRSENTLFARRIVSSVDYLSHQTLRRRVKRAPPPISPPSGTSSHDLAALLGIQDPMFPQQWHLVNDDFPQHMMNVTGVWDMGFKGKGVISSLVDDGLDYESEDLSTNFVRTIFSTNLYLGLLTFGYRMPMTLMILMTTKPYQPPKTLMITMEPDAPAKLQRKRTRFVASVSHTNRKLQVFASYLDL